jgi:hypothetical protein
MAVFDCFIETTGNSSPHFCISCPAFRFRLLTWAHENIDDMDLAFGRARAGYAVRYVLERGESL